MYIAKDSDIYSKSTGIPKAEIVAPFRGFQLAVLNCGQKMALRAFCFIIALIITNILLYKELSEPFLDTFENN